MEGIRRARLVVDQALDPKLGPLQRHLARGRVVRLDLVGAEPVYGYGVEYVWVARLMHGAGAVGDVDGSPPAK